MSEQKVTIVVVTPAMASEWLKRNTRNRHISESYVDSLARDMESGRWMFTHQGIAFDCDGNLLDGQHRLTAIVRSGVPLRMVVTHGMSRNSIAGIDQGNVRSASDVLKLGHSKDVSKRGMAIANAMAAGFAGKNYGRRSKLEQVEFYLEHEGAVNYAERVLPTGSVRLMNAGLAAVIARASYTVDHAITDRFCQVLITGITEEPRDATIIHLRDFVKGAGNKGTMYRVTIYRKTVMALDAFRAGRALGTLRAATKECFFLPGEAKPTELKAVS